MQKIVSYNVAKQQKRIDFFFFFFFFSPFLFPLILYYSLIKIFELLLKYKKEKKTKNH